MDTFEETHAAYADMLRECYGDVNVAGLNYDMARVLADVDPTAYRCGYLDYLDSEGIDSDDLTGEDWSDPREPGFRLP